MHIPQCCRCFDCQFLAVAVTIQLFLMRLSQSMNWFLTAELTTGTFLFVFHQAAARTRAPTSVTTRCSDMAGPYGHRSAWRAWSTTQIAGFTMVSYRKQATYLVTFCIWSMPTVNLKQPWLVELSHFWMGNHASVAYIELRVCLWSGIGCSMFNLIRGWP